MEEIERFLYDVIMIVRRVIKVLGWGFFIRIVYFFFRVDEFLGLCGDFFFV